MIGRFDGHQRGRMPSADVELFRRANRELFRSMHQRPSLRPLAPLLGLLAAMWLGAAGLIAQQLV
jgi:hypothetical protein